MPSPPFLNNLKGVIVRAAIACIFVTLAAGALVRVSAQESKQENVIGWEEAKNNIGKTVTVEGRVVSTRRIGNGIALDFHADFASHFRVIIPTGAAGKFASDPMVRFKQRNVQVTGKVEADRGIPFMRVIDPKNIQTVPVRKKATT